MKKLITFLFVISIWQLTYSQNAYDALKFSEVYYQGTARSMSMGNAFGAIGADFSSLSTNPAGLGLYRSSEYLFSPSIYNNKTNSTYNGNYADDFRTNFALSNLGFVNTNKVDNSAIRYFQFAIGMNRTNNFNNRMLVRGINAQHSKVDVYLDELDGINPANIETLYPYDIYPAWYTYIIDTINGQYTSPIPQGGIVQEELVNTWGSTNEWLISGGMNINDVVFVGATIGMPRIRSFYESTYTEYDGNNNINGFDYWRTKQTIDTRGWGINLKIGVIAWPLDWLRVGAAFHTPTYFELTDNWETTMEADLDGYYNQYTSPNGEYEYNVTTPLRAIGSLAFIIGKNGLISAEYEFVDYGMMRLRASDYTFSGENDDIRHLYKATSNLRFGTEWRVSNFSFRGGYALYGSPLGFSEKELRSHTYSLGVGYIANNNFSLDLAYVYARKQQDYYLYSSTNYTSNATSQDLISNYFVLTTRFKF